MTFRLDIAKFAKATRSTVDEAARAIKIQLFTGVILDTRVKTGRLRGNWQTSTGEPRTGEIDREDKTGEATTSEVVAGVTADGVDYLTNNLPYAEVWEEQDGMVAKNMARIDRYVKEAVRRVRKN